MVENHRFEIAQRIQAIWGGAMIHPERIKNAAVLAAVKVGPGGVCVAGRLWRAGRP